jgi:hypothetical protein
MFSSDLSDDELASILRHMGTAGQRAGVRRKGGEWLVEPLPERAQPSTELSLSLT